MKAGKEISMGRFTFDAVLEFNEEHEVTAEWRKNLFSSKRVGIAIEPVSADIESETFELRHYSEADPNTYQLFERPPDLKNFEAAATYPSQDPLGSATARFYTQDEFFEWVAESLRQIEWGLCFTEMAKKGLIGGDGGYESVEDAEKAYVEGRHVEGRFESLDEFFEWAAASLGGEDDPEFYYVPDETEPGSELVDYGYNSRLPDGWEWTHYDDGSGGLRSPDGKGYFSYDSNTSEYKITYSEKLQCWGFDPGRDMFFSPGGIGGFLSYAENWIIENVLSLDMESPGKKEKGIERSNTGFEILAEESTPAVMAIRTGLEEGYEDFDEFEEFEEFEGLEMEM
jgi:hypothetical protein